MANTIAPLITFPYVSRVLGAEALGNIYFIDSVTQTFLIMAAFGIPWYGAREVAQKRKDLQSVSQLVTDLFSLQFLLSICCILCFLLLSQLFPDAFNDQGLIAIAVITIVVQSASLDWVIQGFEDFRYLSLVTIAARLLLLAGVFLLVKAPSDAVIYYGLFAGGNVLLSFYSFQFIKKRGIVFTNKITWKKYLRPLLVFFLTTATVSLYKHFNASLLGVISGTLFVGFFSTALKAVQIPQAFVNNLGGVMLPRVAHLKASDNWPAIEMVLNKAMNYVLTLTIPLSMGFFLLAPETILIIAGNNFLPAVQPLRIMSPLPVLLGLTNVFGIQALLALGKEKKLLAATFSGGATSIILCVLLCSRYQHNGAAVASICAEAVVMLLTAYFANKLVPMRTPYRLLFFTCLASLPFIPVVFFYRFIFANHPLSVFLSSFFTCVLLYTFLQRQLFKNPIVHEVLQYGMSLLKRKSDI